ncbi:hypothetical protein [Geothrix sp. 21YS21S-2]|uniref:hypothetical protein n=1 Tax=Geothrix sp. 21YS21S-2 TaxID=3068893 RepID=UPI0027B9A27E|nr:hypothetical protein [Geothrix sp. 21YS21S-2]
MIRKVLTPLVICLLAAGSQADAQSKPASRKAEDGMTKLYMQMNNLLFGANNSKSMLILQRPGTMLPDDFSEMSRDQKVMLNDIVDVVPMANPNYVANGNMRYSTIFRAIAQNAQPTEKVSLTAAEEAQLKAAKAYVNDKAKVGKYEALRDAYWEALANEEAAAQNGKEAPFIYKQKKAAAMTKWENEGGKIEYDRQTQILRSLGAKSGDAYWQALNERLQMATVDHNFNTFFYPQPKDWKTNDGWTEISFDYAKKVDENKMSREAINASVKGSHSWFSLDGAFSKTDYSASALMDHEDLKITFKVKRVNIYRSWFDDLVLKNDRWKLPATVNFKEISFGNLVTNRDRTCAMPVLTTALLLVKDLRLDTTLSAAEMSEYQNKMSVKARIGLGPFTLAGGYDKTQAGRKSSTTFTATGVSAPDVQILGLIGTAPDRSPASWVK